jgi:hypothetical protein
VAERSGDTAFGRTEIKLDPEMFRPIESGVAATAFPPRFEVMFSANVRRRSATPPKGCRACKIAMRFRRSRISAYACFG